MSEMGVISLHLRNLAAYGLPSGMEYGKIRSSLVPFSLPLFCHRRGARLMRIAVSHGTSPGSDAALCCDTIPHGSGALMQERVLSEYIVLQSNAG